MKYISGIQALNINCSLDTCGDWHSTGQDWSKLDIRESDDSIFGTWGIEPKKIVPHNDGEFQVANHIRAILDMLESGQIELAQGIRNDYICNEKYTQLIMDKVAELNNSQYWSLINKLMLKEYMMKWVNHENSNK